MLPKNTDMFGPVMAGAKQVNSIDRTTQATGRGCVIITKLSKFSTQEDTICNLTILSITQVTIGKLAI